VYLAKFVSVLNYGIIFWGVQKNSETPFKLQKKCVRVVKELKVEFPVEICFVNYRFLTGISLYIFEILCFIFKNKIYTTL
jgi:hypothetical protein